jgi:hypothetical protein
MSFMERVTPVVDETIRALAKVKFVEDPIAGVGYSRATSIVSSAYKRHGRILEFAPGRAFAKAIAIRSGMTMRSRFPVRPTRWPTRKTWTLADRRPFRMAIPFGHCSSIWSHLTARTNPSELTRSKEGMGNSTLARSGQLRAISSVSRSC